MPLAWILACNRSGSTVLLEMLRRLLQPADIASPDIASPDIASPDIGSLRADFERRVNRWREALAPLDFHSTGVTKLGTIDFIASRGAAFSFVTHLPVARDPFDVVHLCYTNPTRETVAQLGHAPRFAPVRHPLDILVSHAFEYEHVLLEMHGEAQVDAEYRELYGRTRLASEPWLRGAARYIGAYYAELLERGRSLTSVRYEELLADPVATIQDIAATCDVPCTAETAQALWDQVGYQPLRKNSAHLFRPGSGKWRDYLDRSQVAILENTGLHHLTGELGYTWPDDARRSLPALDDDPTERLSFDLAVTDAMNHQMFGTPLTFTDAEIEFVELSDTTRAATNNLAMLATLHDQREQQRAHG